MSDFHFYCKPAPGEQVETALTIIPDTSSAIHGVLTDPDGASVPSALVLLFSVGEDASLALIAQCTTDVDGHFAFGGLSGNTLYRVKVFPQGKRVRELSLCGADSSQEHPDHA